MLKNKLYRIGDYYTSDLELYFKELQENTSVIILNKIDSPVSVLKIGDNVTRNSYEYMISGGDVPIGELLLNIDVINNVFDKYNLTMLLSFAVARKNGGAEAMKQNVERCIDFIEKDELDNEESK
jgi:hypothetical protein